VNARVWLLVMMELCWLVVVGTKVFGYGKVSLLARGLGPLYTLGVDQETDIN
jgi:hypothetical protein